MSKLAAAEARAEAEWRRAQEVEALADSERRRAQAVEAKLTEVELSRRLLHNQVVRGGGGGGG